MSESVYSTKKSIFSIIDFDLSHSQLLLRNKKSQSRDHNIDIIFKGVSALHINTNLEMSDIELIRENEVSPLWKEELRLDSTGENRIFELKSDKSCKFYVNALCFGVYHNSLDILETSIGRYDFENFDELVLWFAG